MPRIGPEPPRYDSLRGSRRKLGWVAWLVRLGVASIGFTLCLDQLQPLVTDVQLTWGERRVAGIVGLSYLASFGLAGWIAGKLIATAADLVDVVVDQAEAAYRTADLLERQAIPTLGRIALALEKLTEQSKAPEPPERPEPDADDGSRALDAARRAIASAKWAQAEKLVGAFVKARPGPEAARLLSELEDARNRAIEGLKRRLESARALGDGLLAVEIRDALTEHLRGDRLAALDRDLVRWLVGEIKTRARAGPIKPELATLASRVADSFADTPEGAALKSSLPNLRRSAGLCPRCARPYKGPADACPRCLLPPPGLDPDAVPLATDDLDENP